MSKKTSFLYTMAIGDAYGMKYEFIPHAQNAGLSDLFYAANAKYAAYKPAHYTDDTQMSLAHAELMLAGNISSLQPDDLIEKWLEAFRRDPHEGYSRHMWKTMSEAADADDFKSRIDASKGTTGGAAMRAGPIGLLADVEEIKRVAKLQAQITHDTPAGITSAQAVALTVHYLHHGGRRDKLGAFLESHLGDWRSAEKGYSEDPANGLKIVSQAVDALLTADTLSGVLRTVVNQSEVSDTDTACALAMIMASRCDEIKDDLPDILHRTLEKGTYGGGYLKQVDEKLLKTFPAQKLYSENRLASRKPGLK